MENITYVQPKTLPEALKILKTAPRPALLAGGTDLLLELRKKARIVETIIDLGRIPELKTITTEGDFLSIGSMVTFAEIKENNFVLGEFAGLYECARAFAAPQIRATATIGGNIINSAAAADSVPCLMSLDGILVLASEKGNREIPVDVYFENYQENKIKSDEILTKILIPLKGYQSGFYKLGKRNALAIARINAAVSLIATDGIVEEVRIALGAVGRYPFRVKAIEAMCAGKPVEFLTSPEVLQGLEQTVFESIKNRPTMPFKKEAIKGVYKEALEMALGGDCGC